MRNILISILLLFPLLASNIVAQIRISIFDEENEQPLRSNVETGYIDGDALPDSIYYDYRNKTIALSLSSRNYEQLLCPYELWAETAEMGIEEGGLWIYESHRRNYYQITYRFIDELAKLQLTNISNEYDGDVTQNGAGIYHFDQMTGKFEADWHYYDKELNR